LDGLISAVAALSVRGSMSRIIEFPTSSVRDWQSTERTLRDILDGTPASEEFKSEIIAKMKIAYDEHEFDYQLSFSVPEASANEISRSLSKFNAALQKHNSDLLISRLKLELELAIAKGL
jgi:hypothetical protein